MLPNQIQWTITSDYLFYDIFYCFNRFFNEQIREEKDFLSKFAYGLVPRKFSGAEKEDKIIFEEDQEVSEMYLFQEGCVSLAMIAYSNKINSSFYKTLRSQKGM